MVPVTDRRHFIQSLMGASLAGFSFGCREAQEVGGPLQALPTSLPHLNSIHVYPVADCKHVLVHLRQSHESNHDEVLHLARVSVSRQTVESQIALRRGISEFVGRLPCHAIYVEGLQRYDVGIMRDSVNGFRDITTEQERFKRRVREARQRYQSPGGGSESELGKISAVEAEIERFDVLIRETVRQLDQQSISHSTAIQIAAAHNLTPESPNTEVVERFLNKFSEPYEKLEALNKRVTEITKRARAIADQYSTHPSPPEGVVRELGKLQVEMEAAVEKRTVLASQIQRQLTSEESNIFALREEAIVSLVAARPLVASGMDTSLVLFGAKHDFLPEVQAHNAKHRDNAIALVVVTPEGLEKIPER